MNAPARGEGCWHGNAGHPCALPDFNAAKKLLREALYSDGYCQATAEGDLLPPLAHAIDCDRDPPHACDCWVMKAYKMIYPAVRS